MQFLNTQLHSTRLVQEGEKLIRHKTLTFCAGKVAADGILSLSRRECSICEGCSPVDTLCKHDYIQIKQTNRIPSINT